MKEARIRKAIERVTAKGVEIVPGAACVGYNKEKKRWAILKSAEKKVCPLGALVLVEQPEEALSGYAAARDALGVDMKWIVCFNWAFDTGGDACGCDACELGRLFRSEILASKNPP